MTSSFQPVLLDTGIILVLCRGGDMGRRLDARYTLLSRREMPWVSAVSVGELFAIALRRAWGKKRMVLLRELLDGMVVVDVNQSNVLDAYARIDMDLYRVHRRMGQQNDQWIAATAAASGALLLTMDRDFDVLHPAVLRREWVDQTTLLSDE